MMRPYSRITMVLKPTQRMVASGISADTLGVRAFTSSSIAASMLDQSHEDLFQSIDLVAHAQHVDTEPRELREQLIEVLLFGDFDFQGVGIDQPHHEVGNHRHRADGVTRIEYEGF